MLKLPLWMLEQLAKAGKTINPSDVFQMSNLDDAVKLFHAIIGH